MSNTPVHYGEYIKQGFLIILVLGLTLFGIKSCRKYQNKRDVIIELSSTSSESAAYEQFYLENAHSNLYKSMYQMHLGVKLGLTPPEILEAVMEEEEQMFSTTTKTELPKRKILIREALLSNYDNCVKLAIFEDAANLVSLSKGEAPTIMNGPAKDELVTIRTIIPDSLLPGVAKILPNLTISPPKSDTKNTKSLKFDNFEISRAKILAQSLETADLIEKDAYKKIVDFYDKVTQAASSVEKATPSEN